MRTGWVWHWLPPGRIKNKKWDKWRDRPRAPGREGLPGRTPTAPAPRGGLTLSPSAGSLGGPREGTRQATLPDAVTVMHASFCWQKGGEWGLVVEWEDIFTGNFEAMKTRAATKPGAIPCCSLNVAFPHRSLG